MRSSVYFFALIFFFCFNIEAQAASVLNYGAKCDGSTNDSNAFKSALAANSVVDVPAGKTCMVRDLVVGSGKTLQGAGATSIVKLPSGSTYMQSVVRVQGSNVKILNLVIDGNKQAHTHLADVGTFACRTNPTNCIEESPTGVVENGGMHALVIGNNAGPVEVRDVYLRNAWTDGLINGDGAHDLLIANVTSDGNRRQGWSGDKMQNVTVRDSIFKNTQGRLPGAGIDIEPEQASEDIVGLRFINNIVSGNNNPLVIDMNGGTVEDIIIENSTFFDNDRPGIDINFVGREKSGSKTTFKNITIRNNKLEDEIRFAANDPGSATFSNIVVENNSNGASFLNHSGAGITQRNNNNANAGHTGTPGAWGGTSPARSCLLFSSGSTPPDKYGAAWDVFAGDKALWVKSNCPTGNMLDITIGRGNASHQVWSTIYVFNSGVTPHRWEAHTLSGTASANGFLSNTGIASILMPFTPSQEKPLFFAGYICALKSNQWKCGCPDSSCTKSFWQLQAYLPQ